MKRKRDLAVGHARCDHMLRVLITAAGLEREARTILRLFETLCLLGNLRPLPSVPRWSGVTDDCSPIELSIALTGRGASVRVLVEAQNDPATALTYWEAAERITQYLADKCGVRLDGLDAVRALFVPSHPSAIFAAWHSVEFSKDRSPLFKIYLNLAAQGPHLTGSLLRAALDRLGFSEAAPGIEALCSTNDRLTHLSLDLTARAEARVKVYIRHFQSDPAELNARAAALNIGITSEFRDMCELVCAVTGVLWQRPVMSCYGVTAADRRTVTQATLYIPLFPYATSDSVSHARLLSLLRHLGFSTAAYSRAYVALAADGSGLGTGLHTYVGYKIGAGEPQLNIYFSPRLFQPEFGCLALDPARHWPSPVM